MTKRIVFTNPDGSIGVMIPAPEAMKDIVAYVEDSEGFGEPIEVIIKKGLTLEEIAQKDIPVDPIYEGTGEFIIDEESLEKSEVKVLKGYRQREWRILDTEEVPEDRTFRNAWAFDGSISVDMPKAREIQIDKIRKSRDEAFKDFDKRYTVAERDKTDLTALNAERKNLQDIPQEAEPLIQAAATPEELKAIWPYKLDK